MSDRKVLEVFLRENETPGLPDDDVSVAVRNVLAENERLSGEIGSMSRCLEACDRVKNRVVAENDDLRDLCGRLVKALEDSGGIIAYTLGRLFTIDRRWTMRCQDQQEVNGMLLAEASEKGVL